MKLRLNNNDDVGLQSWCMCFFLQIMKTQDKICCFSWILILKADCC